MKSDLPAELNTAAAKLSVPATVIGAQAAGWGPQEWVYVATIAYLVMQAAYLAWRWHREWKAKRRG